MEYSIPDISTISGTDTPGIAKKLLNKIIISKTENTLLAARIVETEAYKAPEDKASHAYNNLLTDRTRVMYGPPGRAYIYLCYGIHNMLNIVTGPEGLAHAVLIRALEPIKGHEVFHRRRPVKNPKNMMNGPGKLCQAFDINRDMNNIDLFKKESVLHLGDAPVLPDYNIEKSPRVGVAYAEECAHWLWRFRIKDSKWTSLPHVVKY